jgi:hypothetical protein
MALTPFEIRLEVLKMAKELLVEEYHTQRSALEQDFFSKSDIEKYAMSCNKAYVMPEYPKMPEFPTEKDIMRKAKHLNEFISKG